MAVCRLALSCRGLSVCPTRHNPFSQKHLPFPSLRRDWLRLTRLGPTRAGLGALAGPRSSLPAGRELGSFVQAVITTTLPPTLRRPRLLLSKGRLASFGAIAPSIGGASGPRPIDVGTDWVRLVQCAGRRPRRHLRRPAPISIRVGRLGSFRTVGSRAPAGLLQIGFVCTDGIGLESWNDGVVGRWGISSAGNWLRLVRHSRVRSDAARRFFAKREVAARLRHGRWPGDAGNWLRLFAMPSRISSLVTPVPTRVCPLPLETPPPIGFVCTGGMRLALFVRGSPPSAAGTNWLRLYERATVSSLNSVPPSGIWLYLFTTAPLIGSVVVLLSPVRDWEFSRQAPI